MAEPCEPSWSFYAAGREVSWSCGARGLCVHEPSPGELDIAVVVPDGPASDWRLTRDGAPVAGPFAPERAIARGEDGCGRSASLHVVRDPGVPFGIHRYTLRETSSGAEWSEVGRVAGPGSGDPTPGLVLAGLTFVIGRLLVAFGGGR